MQNMQQMTDYDLAMTLSDFMAAAFLRWDDFTESEKAAFREMENEACKRFIRDHLESLDEPENDEFEEAADGYDRA